MLGQPRSSQSFRAVHDSFWRYQLVPSQPCEAWLDPSPSPLFGNPHLACFFFFTRHSPPHLMHLYAPCHPKPFPQASSLLHLFSPCLSCFSCRASGGHPGWLQGTHPAQHPDPGGRHWQSSQAHASAALPCISLTWLISARSIIKRGFQPERIACLPESASLTRGGRGPLTYSKTTLNR